MTSEKIISTANAYVEGNSLRDREAGQMVYGLSNGCNAESVLLCEILQSGDMVSD